MAVVGGLVGGLIVGFILSTWVFHLLEQPYCNLPSSMATRADGTTYCDWIVLGDGTSWPQSGEVDIMEYYANKVLANVCTPNGSNCTWDSTNQSPASLGSNWSNDFHVWAMEWDAQNIDLYLDGKQVNTYKVSTAAKPG